jgi:hypothetical protein
MEGRRATTTTNKRNPKYNLESSSSSSLSCKEDVEEGFIYVEKESNCNTSSRNSNGTMLLNKRSKSVGDDFLEINGNDLVELEELEGRIELNQQRDDYEDG